MHTIVRFDDSFSFYFVLLPIKEKKKQNQPIIIQIISLMHNAAVENEWNLYLYLASINKQFIFFFEQACLHARTMRCFWQSFFFPPHFSVWYFIEVFWLVSSIEIAMEKKHEKMLKTSSIHRTKHYTFSFAWLHWVERARWIDKRHEMEMLPSSPPPLTPLTIVFYIYMKMCIRMNRINFYGFLLLSPTIQLSHRWFAEENPSAWHNSLNISHIYI